MPDVIEGTATLMAVADVDVDRLPPLVAARDAQDTLRRQSATIEVTDAISAQTATALLGQVVSARRAIEKQRLELTKPLNGVVTKINAAARERREPLEAIEAELKAKVVAYQREEERRVEEERRRLEAEAQRRREAEEAERRAAEQAAREEREAAARETARLEAAAERARQERAESAQTKVGQATGDELVEMMLDTDQALADAANQEARRRAAETGAAVAAAAAAAREAEMRAAEEDARAAPALPIAAPEVAAPARLQGGGAKVSISKRWTFEVVDEDRVPRHLHMLDEVRIRQEIRDGERSIPGLRIFQTEDASVTL